MTTTQHDHEPREPLSPRDRAAWRRAADELLIAAIFGTGHEPLRAAAPVAPSPVPFPPARPGL